MFSLRRSTAPRTSKGPRTSGGKQTRQDRTFTRQPGKGGRGISSGGHRGGRVPDRDTAPGGGDKDRRSGSGRGSKFGKRGGNKGTADFFAPSDPPVFSAPTSFLLSWFIPKAILLFEAVGFIVKDLLTIQRAALGGRTNRATQAWSIITSNPWVTNVVNRGYNIPFKGNVPPRQSHPPKNPNVQGDAFLVLIKEMKELLGKGAIYLVDKVKGQWCSAYFAVPKKQPHQFRPILNLKFFNLYVKKYKFRMETIAKIREWIIKDSFLASWDLKDAYLTVPMAPDTWRFMRFTFQDKLYEWRVLPFGLTCSPRVFTRLLRQILAFLKCTWGILISAFLDDILVQASSYYMCYFHMQLSALVLMACGYSLNYSKSSVLPSKVITHLGFIWNTEAMTITVPQVEEPSTHDFTFFTFFPL